MGKSSIEWTGQTWNPTVGCSRVSPGCDGCYAVDVAHRAMQPAHVELTVKRPGERSDWTGEVRCLPERLEIPLKRKKPTTWFVDSMSDLFHPEVDDLFIAEVFAVMRLTPQHTYQVLTKRPKQMAALLSNEDWRYKVGLSARKHATGAEYPGPVWPMPNVWLGTSVENQRYADMRVPQLLQVPAAVRFLSIEPLLGPVDLGMLEPCDHVRQSHEDIGCWMALDWVIVGGESGPGARPMHPGWARSLRDQCVKAGVPYFFKQWGAWSPYAPIKDGVFQLGGGITMANDGSVYQRADLAWPDGPRRGEAIRAGHDRAELHAMYRHGVKGGGRELDGRTWDEMPSIRAIPPVPL